MAESSVLSALQKLVGREFTYTDEFEVEKGMLRRFAIATGDSSPIYYDEETAKQAGYSSVVAPPTFLFEWNHHKHGALPRELRASIFSGLKRQPPLIRGINEYEMLEPVCPGDIIKTQARVTQVYEKQGKSGRLVFVICETSYSNQRRELLGKGRDTLIFLPEKGE